MISTAPNALIKAGDAWPMRGNHNVDALIRNMTKALRTLQAENDELIENINGMKSGLVHERDRHDTQIAALTTKLTEAEAMLAVKPSAMEYADLQSQLEQAEVDQKYKNLYTEASNNLHTSLAHAADLNAQLEQKDRR